MEHKAGVPKGGTFIMVYHETQRRKYVADQWLHDQSQAMETNMLIRDAYVENPQLVRKFEKALETFMDACNDMKPQERENIRIILTNIPAKEKPLKFQIPDEAVIADFYLPYICCSDCAPISYVLPAPPRETNDPVFDLLPRRFCVKDRNSYDFQIQPFPGKLSEISNPDNLRIIADKNEKTLRFQPARHRIQSTRDFHLEYHGISLDVQVVVPDAGFTMQFLKKGKGRDQLLLQPMQTTASTYKWTILQAGNSLSFNSATVELTAENSEIYMQRKFSISLQINHELPSGNCSDEQEFVMTPELVKKYMDSGEEFDHKTGQ